MLLTIINLSIMKSILLLLCIALSVAVKCQTIKMKIATYTSTDGETINALELTDTLPVSTSGGTGSGTGISKFNDLKVKKMAGLSTNELLKRSIAGTQLPQVDFEYYDNTNTLFYKIVIRDVFVSQFSYLSPECANCTSLQHQVNFYFTRIEVTDVASGNVLRYNRSTRTFY